MLQSATRHLHRIEVHQLVGGLIALMSFSVSLMLTIDLCRELGYGGGTRMAVALGIIWELAKCYFATMGLLLIHRERLAQRIAGLVLLVLASVLICGSVAASLGYMVDTDARSVATSVQQSHEYQEITHDIALVDTQVQTLTAAANADVEHDYRRRALQTLSRVDELHEQRLALINRMSALSVAPSELRLFSGLSRLLHTDPQQTKLAAFAVLAVMLEIIGVAALALMRSTAPVPDVSTKSHNEEYREVPSEDKSRYAQARKLILAGEVQPSYRDLREHLQLGQGTAKRFIEDLLKEGVITKVGRRYIGRHRAETSAA